MKSLSPVYPARRCGCEPAGGLKCAVLASLWLTLVTVSPAPVCAGTSCDSTRAGIESPDSVSAFPATFFEDHASIWSAPFRMDSHEVLVAGGIAAVATLAVVFDQPVYRAFRDFQHAHAWVRTVSPIASQLGEFHIPYGIAGSLCVAGLLTGNNETTEIGLLAIEAMVHTGIVIQVLKHLFGRTRPFVHDGRDVWYGPRTFFKRYSDGGFSPYDSFPSGHTITAFSLATVIAERCDDSPFVGYVSYSGAALCGLSRLTEHDHWLSDVIVGAALGIGIGKLIVRNHERRVVILPSAGNGSAAFAVGLIL